jgi:hypothetical protein
VCALLAPSLVHLALARAGFRCAVTCAKVLGCQALEESRAVAANVVATATTEIEKACGPSGSRLVAEATELKKGSKSNG